MLACTFVIDKVKHKLQLRTDNFHSCLQCSFQKLLGCYHSEKLERGHRVCQQNLQMEKFAKIFRVFDFYTIFQKLLHLSAQVVPHRNFNAKRQYNFLKLHYRITSKKLQCVATSLPYKT